MTTAPVPTPAVQDFSDALSDLGAHAALMDQRDEAYHDACTYCETMKLLSRVAAFGIQLRTADRDRQ